ncbi:unnamed protein product [Alopecurus aequalis]
MGKRPRSEDEEPQHLLAGERPRRGRLHLIVRDHMRGCTVYKLDVDGFRPNIKDEGLDSRARSLPAHRVAIRLASPDGQQYDQFACTGSKIFAFHRDGGSMVYDSETSTVAICPPLSAPNGTHELLAVGQDIYALETTEDRSGFHASMERLGPAPRPHSDRWEAWRWEALPPPPFNKRPGEVLSTATHPDDSALFVSFEDRGTFSFDTGRLKWTRLGDWLLPFRGEAYFVRELDAWVGLSDQIGYIGVCQVISPADGHHTADPPAWTTVRERVYSNVWKRHLSARLTYMGNAEFCLLETVAREDYDIYRDDDPRMLLRLATFRVERRRNRELRAVNMRTGVYKWPHSQERATTAFWIGQDD